MTLAKAGRDFVAPVSEPVAVQQDSSLGYIAEGLNSGIYNDLCRTDCVYEDVTYGVTLRSDYELK